MPGFAGLDEIKPLHASKFRSLNGTSSSELLRLIHFGIGRNRRSGIASDTTIFPTIRFTTKDFSASAVRAVPVPWLLARRSAADVGGGNNLNTRNAVCTVRVLTREHLANVQQTRQCREMARDDLTRGWKIIFCRTLMF